MFVKKIVTFLAALLLSTSVAAETLVFAHKDGKNHFRFRLHDTPCKEQTILDRFKELGVPEEFKVQAGDVIWANDYFKSCWFIYNDKVIQMATDLQLIQPSIPLNLFSKEDVI